MGHARSLAVHNGGNSGAAMAELIKSVALLLARASHVPPLGRARKPRAFTVTTRESLRPAVPNPYAGLALTHGQGIQPGLRDTPVSTLGVRHGCGCWHSCSLLSPAAVFPGVAEAHGPVAPVALDYLARVDRPPGGLVAKAVDGDQRMALQVPSSE